MLHLHCLVWFLGAFHIEKLWQQLLTDSVFTMRMIKFIDQIIKNLITVHSADLPNHLCEAPLALLDENDATFTQKLEDNSNAIASKRQMHLRLHNKTCFKYAPTGAEHKCWFDFPRSLVEKTFITKYGTIDI